MELPTLPSDQWTFRRVMGATLILVLVALGFWLLYQYDQAVLNVLIALVLGTVVRPVVVWLHGRGLPRFTSAVLVYLVLLALLSGFVLR
jgi:putative heme transporter